MATEAQLPLSASHERPGDAASRRPGHSLSANAGRAGRAGHRRAGLCRVKTSTVPGKRPPRRALQRLL